MHEGRVLKNLWLVRNSRLIVQTLCNSRCSKDETRASSISQADSLSVDFDKLNNRKSWCMSLSKELKERGVIYQMSSPELVGILDKTKTSIYVGFDPSADSLTVGNLLQIVTMRRLQMFGHRPVFVAGGATGMIGDPSGKSSERNLLSKEQLQYNLDSVSKQLHRYLEFNTGRKSDALLVDNASWFSNMKLLDFLRDVGKYFNVSPMLQKDSVRNRLGEGQSLSFTEFSYMLLQAYDFFQLSQPPYDVQVQFGGSDQWANIVSGIDYIRRVSGKGVYGMTTPLVTKADGTKFGKSEGNAIWLDPSKSSPYEMYQFFVRSEDVMVGTYLRYFTFLEIDEIEALEKEVELHADKRQAHRVLAHCVVSFVHGEDEARKAEQASSLLYSGGLKDAPKDVVLLALSEALQVELPVAVIDSTLDPADLLALTPLVKSKSEARRTMIQGGLYINDEKVRVDQRVTRDDLLFGELLVLRRGKREYCLVRIV